MTEKRKLVMATNNAGKLREARAIAGDRLEILSLSDIGFNSDIPETADSLAGNALLKVRAIKEVCDLDVFADDTGLLVDALGGAPGVYSARYAGEECDPEKNIELLLKNLDGVDDRRARFRTSIALSLDGEEHLFDGEVKGRIATQRSGSNGFGYDPVFIADETGRCFAEMSDDEKNAISHRGRAVTAMMRWITTLCLMLSVFLPASAEVWTLFNTFGENVQYVFDTEDKTYFLVQAQPYMPVFPDNGDNLNFLFSLDKKTDEIQHLNSINKLSNSLIQTAYYNAAKKYLLIVYTNSVIDILHDNGEVHTILGLADFDTPSSKKVRSISFDAERNLAYLATDFGFVAINDVKYEVASSGVYDQPIDYIARADEWLLIVSDGKLLRDSVTSQHIAISDFKPTSWANGLQVLSLYSLAPDKCVFSVKGNPLELHYILTFTEGNPEPANLSIGSIMGASVVENRDGLLFTRTSQLVEVDRNTTDRIIITRSSDENYGVPVGSWDLKEVFYAKPNVGFHSERIDDNGEWTVTRQSARPNVPAAFRSNAMKYDARHGLMVCSHGINNSFVSHLAPNPLQLSIYRDGSWTESGLGYFDSQQRLRMTNPCGFAQDPDNPDIYYFGSVLNGLIRYNIKDFSSLLHFTRSNDNPAMPGHVPVSPPHAVWGSTYMLLNPSFDSFGNLVMTHTNTDNLKEEKYEVQLWMWTPEKRRATDSPETFQPFKILNLDEFYSPKLSLALPMRSASARTLVNVFAIDTYNSNVVVYDHSGTPDDESDDRQVLVKSFKEDNDPLEYHYIFCAIEDPETGLVWVGTDNGVFTFDPKRQFSETGVCNRIKVSRNDGTSLADYLLNGSAINDISIDGRGRKWFSLSGGGIVCTSADGRTVLQEYNTDNSDIPGDDVYATCYNPDNGSIMISTEAGLSELRFDDSSNQVTSSDVHAYPNPVRPDYFGYVTITGLEDGCIVKIADSAGNIVREIGPAANGKVQWDVCNARLDRVASGVYFVLASSGAEGGSFNEVSKILVVNN